MQGQSWCTDGIFFKFWSSLYADDAGLVVGSRQELEQCVPVLHTHLKRFGLLMHVGSVVKKSKTEAMFCPRPGQAYEDANTSDVAADDVGGIVSFTKLFKYLGSQIDSSLRDDSDVLGRVKSAAGAFGALRESVFGSKRIKLETKKTVYLTLVVNILLYGSECWCLTEALLHRLRVFHHGCVRAMLGVKRSAVWRCRIKTSKLLEEMRMETIDHYISLRKLRWAGHIARMPKDRLPRKFLTSWIRRPRPHGRPQYTFGHSLNKTLKQAGIPGGFGEWTALAQDRRCWRDRIYSTAKFPPEIQHEGN